MLQQKLHACQIRCALRVRRAGRSASGQTLEDCEAPLRLRVQLSRPLRRVQLRKGCGSGD